MRLIFAGTPEVAVPSLRALLDSDHDVVAVLTRPDARAGRGRRLVSSPVKQLAAEYGIPTLQPESLRDADFRQQLADFAPDCCPVVAFGGLVPPELLSLPQHGWVNLHFSLLPAWRGAAPVQHAIMAGDEVTGAVTFQLEAGLDTGPVFGTMTQTIRPDHTSGTLLQELAVAGAGLLVATMDGLASGQAVAVAQSADGVSHAGRITTDMARVDWQLPAHVIDRRIRGCTPAPGAWTTLAGQRVKIGPVHRLPGGSSESRDDNQGLPPGRITHRDGQIMVGTGSAPVVLTTVQPAGKQSMASSDWWRGLRDHTAVHFDESEPT